MRFTIAAVSLLTYFFVVWVAGAAGLSRLLSEYGVTASLPVSAEMAVRLCDSDPEAHYARGIVFSDIGRLEMSVKEYERATALRPRDYFLWLELGRARDQAGDQQGALAAFNQTVRLAPYYAQPRWQLGNLLLRAGRRDEAFAELRHAARSDPALLPAVLDLAWGAYAGEARSIEEAVRPQTTGARVALARFLIKHGSVSEAMTLYRAMTDASDADRRALLTDLLAAKRFAEAYEVWSPERGATSGERRGTAAVVDGGFEGDIVLDDVGFGWQPARDTPTVRVSLDTENPRAGMHSLLIAWSGDADPNAPVMSQLVLVEPNARYRLSFMSSTREVVTGGLPIITVTNASGDDERVLARSSPLPQGTRQWQGYRVEFVTAGTISAIRLSIRRQNCGDTPCPIFGRTWFDDFSLQKL